MKKKRSYQKRVFQRIALVLAGLWIGSSAGAGVFNPETFTLKNGMQVVVLTNRMAPVISHQVWYKVGAMDEAPGESGNAHFFEHLMFKGTKKKPGGFSKEVAQVGGRENAFTSWNYTAYYQNVHKGYLETFMKYEADRMTGLVLSEDLIRAERDVVIEERRQRTDNSPPQLLGEQVMKTVFQVHPYGTPIIGWREEIEKLNTETAMRFYKKWYAPNNAILIVAGDISAKELKPLAEKYYGVIPAHKNLPQRAIPKEPEQERQRIVDMTHPKMKYQVLQLDFRAPTPKTAASQGVNAYAIKILASILTGQSSSRLTKRLEHEEKIVNSVRASYYDIGIGETLFSIDANFKAKVDRDKVLAAIMKETEKKFATQGITAIELKKFQRLYKIRSIYAQDSLTAGARAFGRALTSGYTVKDVEEELERVQAVTAEEVKQAAQKIFQEKNSVVGWLRQGPEERTIVMEGEPK